MYTIRFVHHVFYTSNSLFMIPLLNIVIHQETVIKLLHMPKINHKEPTFDCQEISKNNPTDLHQESIPLIKKRGCDDTCCLATVL